jgi:membrane protein required for colicin V production
MTLDLLLLLVLGTMAALGAWRGALVSGTALLGLVCGYAGAIWAGIHWAGWVADTLVVSALVAPAIAGTLGFVLAWLMVSCASELWLAWDRQRGEEVGRGRLDRAFGAFFGLARGGLIVVLLAILVSWLDAGRDLGALEGFGALPDAESSSLVGASGGLVEATVAKALSDAGPAGEVAARLTARPGQALESMQTLLENERLNAVLSDKLFWTLLQNDSIDYAMNRSSVRGVVHDPELRGYFVDLGFVGSEARDDPEAFRAEMVAVLSEVAPHIARLQHDPAMKELASDPEIIRIVQSGDTLALMSNPGIGRLAERLAQEPDAQEPDLQPSEAGP